MKKRILSMLLAIVIVAGLIPMSAITAFAATTTGTTGDVSWSFDDTTGTLTVSGEGAIGGDQSWIEHVDSITSIVIEDGITSIANYAFYECSNLEILTLPASVETIGNYAFAECSNLGSVTIPASVKSIGNSAFYGCSSLATVNYLGTSEPSMGDYVFVGCNLTTVNVPVDYEGDTFGGLDVSKTLVDEPTPTGVASVTTASGTEYYDTIESAIAAAEQAEDAEVTLLENIS
ncbi:MAG: leucine-rich repeat domain-containing protein, partial [Clostridia bacterium]|nr:leucine-rich repeat domain-containing protein [Clostridia bacterium]